MVSREKNIERRPCVTTHCLLPLFLLEKYKIEKENLVQKF
jgi:hypothetical protein